MFTGMLNGHDAVCKIRKACRTGLLQAGKHLHLEGATQGVSDVQACHSNAYHPREALVWRKGLTERHAAGKQDSGTLAGWSSVWGTGLDAGEPCVLCRHNSILAVTEDTLLPERNQLCATTGCIDIYFGLLNHELLSQFTQQGSICLTTFNT